MSMKHEPSALLMKKEINSYAEGGSRVYVARVQDSNGPNVLLHVNIELKNPDAMYKDEDGSYFFGAEDEGEARRLQRLFRFAAQQLDILIEKEYGR